MCKPGRFQLTMKFLKGCAIFMSQYNKACLKISNHLNPDADEFEEDIVEKSSVQN